MNKIEIRKLSIRKCKTIMKRTTGKKGKKRSHDIPHATKNLRETWFSNKRNV